MGPGPSVGLTLTWFIWDRNLALHVTLHSLQLILMVKEATVSPFAAPGSICCRNKICFPGSKRVSEFVQKHFASSLKVSSFARRGKVSASNVSTTMFPRLRGPLRVGSATKRGPIQCNKPDIVWVEEEVLAPGVWFVTDKLAMLLSNYEERITKIQNLIGLWQFRRLTLIGKIILIKSLLASQLIYILTALPTVFAALQTDKKLFYEFLWDGKGDKIKRDFMTKKYKRGDLRMIDINLSNHRLIFPGSR